MSPEQFGSRADYRSDVYSLGVVLYEMLAGRVPYSTVGGDGFPLGMVAFWELIKGGGATHVDDVVHGLTGARLPEGLGDCIMRAMHHDADERYQAAAEMREALLPFYREVVGERELQVAEAKHDVAAREKALRAVVAEYGTPKCYLALARCYHHQQRRREAIQVLEEGVARHRGSAELLMDLGTAHWRHDKRAARLAFELAVVLGLGPSDQANLDSMMGPHGRDSLEEALQIARISENYEGPAGLLVRLGELHLQRGDLVDALQAFELALRRRLEGHQQELLAEHLERLRQTLERDAGPQPAKGGTSGAAGGEHQ
jgi:tetratricopeptide (TPR) repeat protein